MDNKNIAAVPVQIPIPPPAVPIQAQEQVPEPLKDVRRTNRKPREPIWNADYDMSRKARGNCKATMAEDEELALMVEETNDTCFNEMEDITPKNFEHAIKSEKWTAARMKNTKP